MNMIPHDRRCSYSHLDNLVNSVHRSFMGIDYD